MDGVLVQLALILAPLSLVAVGGGSTVLPEIHRQVVEVHRWLSEAEFADLFALGRAAPGPNVLVVTLIGWKVAGLAGGLVATLAMCGPCALLAGITARAWRRFREAPWRRPIEAGLAPIAVGLMLASGVVLTGAADTSLPAYAVTLATVVLLLRTGLPPLVLMAAAAVMALAGWL
jgi:chromate transporter